MFNTHQITTKVIYRYGQQMFRYECTCGKQGKYHKLEGQIRRGAMAHLRMMVHGK